MRNFLYFIAPFFLFTSCITYSWLNDKECDNLSNTKRESDMSQYIYLVDTISYDSINFCILNRSGFLNGNYYVQKSFLINRKKIREKDIINSNYPIFLFYFWHDIDEYGCKIFEDYNSNEPVDLYQQYAVNDEWIVFNMKLKPSFLRVYMIRGDFLKFLHQYIWDSGPFYDFKCCNKHAYYKVVVPAWKEMKYK